MHKSITDRFRFSFCFVCSRVIESSTFNPPNGSLIIFRRQKRVKRINNNPDCNKFESEREPRCGELSQRALNANRHETDVSAYAPLTNLHK